MGLEEKRHIKILQDNVIPEFIKGFNAASGGSVTVNIDWDSFDSKEALQEVEHQVLGRILSAVRDLCREDDLAKEAVQEGLKTVTVKNLASAVDKRLNFRDGTLHIEAEWRNYSDIFSAFDIRKTITAGL